MPFSTEILIDVTMSWVQKDGIEIELSIHSNRDQRRDAFETICDRSKDR